MRKKTVPFQFKVQKYTLATLLLPYTFSSLAQVYVIAPGTIPYLAFTHTTSIHGVGTMTEMLRVQSYFVAILHFLQTQY
jgi:hypothetical protein